MDARTPATQSARATIKTVAKDAGVSVAAVSKVLRNAYGVSDALRHKVQASIEKLGYRPNTAARAMRGHTYTIGVLLVEIANPFLPQVVDGANDVLSASNYKTMFGIGQSQSTMEASLIESMISHQMDGLILVAPQIHGRELAHYAKQIPMVVVGHHEATATAFDTVNSDDREGAAMAVRAFIERGYTDIAMLGMTRDGNEDSNVDTQREAGFRAAMQRHGDSDPVIWRSPYVAQERSAEIRKLLQQQNRPRALFCWSDLDAVRVIDVAHQLKIKVPEDLAVIGYDNSNVAAFTAIDLASMDQSGRRLGSLAAETLLSRIAGRRVASHLLIEPTFVSRRSVG